MFWHYHDIQFLRDNYMNKKVLEIANRLNRTVDSIYHKAMRLGLRKNKLSKKKIEELKKSNPFEIIIYYDELTKLGRWSKKDECFLIENYEIYTITEMAEKLNRTVIGVSNKIQRLKGSGKL